MCTEQILTSNILFKNLMEENGHKMKRYHYGNSQYINKQQGRNIFSKLFRLLQKSMFSASYNT